MVKKASKGRLRVFFAEFDGDDETIQEGLRAIGLAVTKTFQPQRIVKYLPASAELGEQVHEELVDDDVEDIDEDEVVAELPPKTRSKSSRKPPTMTLVKELNLRPSDKKHLRDFVSEKKPSTQAEQITVCVYYLCRILEIDGVTANHVFTCFKDVAIRVPQDLPQIIRNTANRKGTVDTSDSASIKITNRGENMVEHDLPAAGKRAD